MSDRVNRIGWVVVSLLLLAIGGLGLSLAEGAWGQASPRAVVDPVVVRWWHDGGWKSFASVAFIGLVLLVLGLLLAWAELRRRGPAGLRDFEPLPWPERSHESAEPEASRGSTTVRAAPLSRALEADMRLIDGVQHASVGIRGRPGELELRARLEVDDQTELAAVGNQLDEVLGRLALTAGFGADLVDVTVILVAPVGRVS
ncbi:MAG: hypothetical protein ACRDY2_10520 [Acidimicrobiales bacterium]